MLALLIAAAVAVPAAEQAAIFTAAGFSRRGSQWRTDCDQPDGDSYEPGSIETFRDLNRDGRPEALVTEGGTYCYGNTGAGFILLTRLASGKWKLIHKSQGIAEFLPTLGVDQMPDISIGGPGFCFPVLRWNGKAYVQNRYQYEGKVCRPQ
jgi:hypothetical protein